MPTTGVRQHYLLLVRLADFARALEDSSALSLDKFLLQVVEQEQPIPRLGEFMRLAPEKGACMVLLDGLDEVGDDPARGQPLRQPVLKKVQTFADRWCTGPADRPNRLAITSRIEGYWEDPRWHEVILLAAGQLGIVEARRDDASDFIEDLLKVEPTDPANAGRQVVLAGRALAGIGPRSVTKPTRRWALDALRETMQDLDPDTQIPNQPPQTAIRIRFEAGQALDELGWLPPDLNTWLRCQGCVEDGGDLLVMKYPVTNALFERFILAGGYENPAYEDLSQSLPPGL